MLATWLREGTYTLMLRSRRLSEKSFEGRVEAVFILGVNDKTIAPYDLEK